MFKKTTRKDSRGSVRDTIVKVEQLLPNGAQTVVQQVYHIVKIPKTSKPVEFEMAFE